MTRYDALLLSGLLGIGALIASASASTEVVRADEAEDLVLDVPELESFRDRIVKLDLDGAEKVLKEAKKELKPRKREKEVKAALATTERQIAALKELKKAERFMDKRAYPKALRSMNKVLRKYGEIWFAEEAGRRYSELKASMFYVINDFESEKSRESNSFGTASSGGKLEVIQDVRFSSEGRYALRVKLDVRGDRLKASDLGAYRAVSLGTPADFAEKLGTYRAVTFSIYSHRSVDDLISVDIMGDLVGTTATSFASHAGISLKFVGRRQFTLKLNHFNFRGGFQWKAAGNLQFSTTGSGAVEFTIDDVRLVP